MANASRGWTEESRLTAGLIAGIFVVYALGASRTIYVGDSGELATAAAILGIPHPSGYPLYVLLGKLFVSLFSLGSIPFRLSIFSAVCAAASCGLLFRILRETEVPRLAGLFAALLLAFSPSFWAEANIQRVYSLNALFVTAATLFALRWVRRRSDRDLVIAFFLCGLGATNHTFMGIYGIALAIFVLFTDIRILRRTRTLFQLVLAALLGLLPYLYLPLRSRMNPPLDWGNPETLSTMWRVVLRADFWDRRWYRSAADLVPISADFFRSFLLEFFWAGAVLAVIGMIVGWRKGRPVMLPVLVLLANLGTLALHGSRSDLFLWHRYYIPAYVMAALLAGWGAAAVLERIPARVAPLLLTIPALMLALNFGLHNRSRYRIAEDFSRTLLSTLPPGATLIANDDNILFVLIYLRMVERTRPDVHLVLEGVSEAELPPLHFNPDEDPVFLTHHPNWQMPGLDLVPVGMSFRAWRSGREMPPVVIPRTRLEGELDPRVSRDYLTSNLIGHFHYMLGVTFEASDWLRARAEFEEAMRASPDNDVLFYNLGLIYLRNGLFEESLAAFRRSHQINPREIPSPKSIIAEARISSVAAERDRVQALEAAITSSAGLVPGSAAFHQFLARELDLRGEMSAARGHRLRILEMNRSAQR